MNDTVNIDRPPKRPLVDEKSFELAEHFLEGLEGDTPTEDQKWELADVIQQAVEGWFDGRGLELGMST